MSRILHKFVGMLRGRLNTCYTQRNDGSYSPKVDYKSYATALKSAVRLTEKWGRPFDAYQCFFCNGWHIGGKVNLDFWSFWSIVWVWLIGKKRTVRKARMRVRESNKIKNCERCGNGTNATIMSMFNMEEICLICKEAEKKRPDYNEAVKAEERAMQQVITLKLTSNTVTMPAQIKVGGNGQSNERL